MSKLIIVESPTKAKTISGFLGKDYTVLSSFGHVRDLPKSKIGVDVEHGFAPQYEIPERAEDKVAELQKAAKRATEIFLAPDEDREGEAIAWHLHEVLGIKKSIPVKRIAFHEITKEAILHALETPRDIDASKVDAQQARRILDRLVGYELSPFLWKKVQRGLSAGRVQSVAVRLIVERERERRAFKTDEYWTIDALFNKDKQQFDGKLAAIAGTIVKKLDIKTEKQAKEIEATCKTASFTVSAITTKRLKKAAPKPLTTAALQIAANGDLGFSAKQTMVLAQQLYETGLITYMRTDSLNLAKQFVDAAQTFLRTTYGDTYATGVRTYTTKQASAQEAHEAIRPTDVSRTPDNATGLDAKQKKLYTLIWGRTVASQMPDAELERTSVDLAADKYTFRSTGSMVVFDGYMKVYKSAAAKLLPQLAEGDSVAVEQLLANQHFTEPPARYSDATLVKILEDHGIGRPSTYAPTIATVIARGYVERDDNKKLAPLDVAFIVNDVLVEHFSDIVDFEFTADMEKQLDDIADGSVKWQPVLENFYTPFHDNLTKKDETLTRQDVKSERVLGTDPDTGLPVMMLTGRFGPYIQLGERAKDDKTSPAPKRSSLLKGMSIETLTLEDALSLLTLPRTLGKTKDGDDITALNGPYGPYLKAGKVTATLPEDIDPRTISLAAAEELLKNAKELAKQAKEPLAELGQDPTNGNPLLVKIGRFGPYVTNGELNASIGKKYGEPSELTREQAIELLERKRARDAAKGKGKKPTEKKTKAKAKPKKKTAKKTTANKQ